MSTNLVPEALVFGYGNPSRGDDALGPAIIECLREHQGTRDRERAPELLTDFQLQPEHALDLRGRARILFVDASFNCEEPYQLTRLEAARDADVFTHALAPGALLSVYERIERSPAPDSWMLGIRGYSFELGQPLSARAEANLAAALLRVIEWIEEPDAISPR